MIKLEQFSSAKVIYKEAEDFEIVNCVSERNETHDYKSLTFSYGCFLEQELKKVLSAKYKNFDYKILVIAEEQKDELLDKKIIILLKTTEVIDYLKSVISQNSVLNKIFSESKIEINYLTEKPKPIEISSFKQNIQKWCNEFQKYLVNQKNFNGITKINAVSLDRKLKSLEIVVSGKGTTNEIVFVSKKISKKINNLLLRSNQDEIFKVIDEEFKS